MASLGKVQELPTRSLRKEVLSAQTPAFVAIILLRLITAN